MKNCFDCKVMKECDCGEAILMLEEYLPYGVYDQIKDVIMSQFNCEYHE